MICTPIGSHKSTRSFQNTMWKLIAIIHNAKNFNGLFWKRERNKQKTIPPNYCYWIYIRCTIHSHFDNFQCNSLKQFVFCEFHFVLFYAFIFWFGFSFSLWILSAWFELINLRRGWQCWHSLTATATATQSVLLHITTIQLGLRLCAHFFFLEWLKPKVCFDRLRYQIFVCNALHLKIYWT